MAKNLSHKIQQDLRSNDPKLKQSAMQTALQIMRQQYNEQMAESEISIAYMKEKLLGKLVLTGILGQGVNPTYVTDIRSDTPGVVAVALSTKKDAGEDGMYFDARQLTFFYVYNEVETARWEEKFATQQANAVKLMPARQLPSEG